MRVQIKGGGHDLNIVLPTRMIFSKTMVKIGCRISSRYTHAVMDRLSPEAMEAICEELVRIKKKHGKWELVDIQSADGEKINITL